MAKPELHVAEPVSELPITGTAPDERNDVGARIRSVRSDRNMTLRELARRLQVSAGHLSQVERGLVTPSISLLYSIAEELSLGMSDLFGNTPGGSEPVNNITPTPGEDRFITRSANRRAINLDTGVRWELLTPTTREPVDFREIVYPVGAGSAKPGSFVQHNGREYGLVLSGRLHVQLEFDEYELGPGDTIAFDSAVPHRFWNDGPDTVKAVWCSVSSVPEETCAF